MKNKMAKRLIYDEPATDWESQALPIGNGNMGAMIFSGVGAEKLQINESSIWSGGPGASTSYDGGDNELSTEEVHEVLQSVRQNLQDMVTDFLGNKKAYLDDKGKIVSNDYKDLLNDSTFSKNLNKLKGEKNNFGSYQTFGNLNIVDPAGNYSEYLRTSDIDKAVNTVSYKLDGVEYKRVYFANNPSNVIVARLTADQSGKLTRNIYFDLGRRRLPLL